MKPIPLLLFSQLKLNKIIIMELMTITIALVAIFVGILIGFKLATSRINPAVFESAPVEPHIVVNVPPDWKPMETLPVSAVEGARAALWYTVFKATAAHSDTTTKECVDYASEAVEKCFGDPDNE